MHEMIVKLTWDADKLGPMWMNPDNLALLLYSTKFSTKPSLLLMDVVDHTEWRGTIPIEQTVGIDVQRDRTVVNAKSLTLDEVGHQMLDKISADKRLMGCEEIDWPGLSTGKYDSAYFAMPGYEIKDWLGTFG